MNILHKTYKINILEDEYWWGGSAHQGVNMPFGEKKFEMDLRVDSCGNQTSPILVSNKGRYVWSEFSFKFELFESNLIIEGRDGAVVVGDGHNDLRGAFNYVSQNFFSPDGKLPEIMLLTEPQYNTWIEMMYEPTQEKTLKYARDILNNDMPAGVLMIDDNWQEDYGVWNFSKERFPEPEKMVNELHEMGFKVMLWVCPFVSPDSFVFRMLEKKGYLIKNAKGETAIRRWWNGYSGVLDLTNPEAINWFTEKLDEFVDKFGIDGFKFDAGDIEFYENEDISFTGVDRNGHCEAWAKLGLKYELNEYRVCWKMAGRPLVQRLRDKPHTWDGEGLVSLIPNGLAQGIMGYSFNCPDMIGGGDFSYFLEDNLNVDQELVVRYAQCSALFPMMQFSAAPWRILDEEHNKYCVDAAKLHASMGNLIESLAVHASKTGEPIIRYMEYEFPGNGYEGINDQFMLGSEILVAPVITKAAVERTVVFPEGKWLGDDGSKVVGPCTCAVKAPISRLPWYKKSDR